MSINLDGVFYCMRAEIPPMLEAGRGSIINIGSIHSVTGIAGPGGGSEAKPVGLVYIALCDDQKTEVTEKNIRGDRQRVREWTTQQALDLIRRRLR